MNTELVSIIMLSQNSSQYVEESVRSVLAQTYTNWELLFVDDSSNDGTIQKVSELRGQDNRIRISQSVYKRGETANRNSALREARGRWIAFLDVGDVWHPEKLARQIVFMEENGYAFSYTSYGLMNEKSESHGVVISGKDHVTHQDMLKCCWPTYLTVMYDAEKVGRLHVKEQNVNNDYALWLDATDRCDCYLLSENLATMRTHWGLMGKFIMTNKFKWRYDCYFYQEGLNGPKSYLYAIRSLLFGVWKWMRYVKRVKR